MKELLKSLVIDTYEREPDQNRWLPHHALLGILIFGVGWYLWHPAGNPELGSTVALLGLLVSLDDVVDHKYGGRIRDFNERVFGVRVGTPLDFVFRWVMGNVGVFRRVYRYILRAVYR